MTQKIQRQPGRAGAGKVVLLKRVRADHIGNTTAHQHPMREVRMGHPSAEAKIERALESSDKDGAIQKAIIFSGSVVATSVNDGLLTLTIGIAKDLRVDCVIRFLSPDTGVQKAGRELMAQIFRAAECNAMIDSDELIGCRFAVAVSAGGAA
jgi:hypothetical protein